MVTITAPKGQAPAIHTGGSAGHPDVATPREREESPSAPPATIVTLSDRAKQLVDDAKAAQAVLDILAATNGVVREEGGKAPSSPEPQVVIAHDAATNEGLYVTWSDDR